MARNDAFLPDELRPVQITVERPKARYRLLLILLLLAVAGASIPLWRLQAVDLDGGGILPAAARVSVAELAGTPLFVLDFSAVRRGLEVWPQVGSVDVHLELDGVLRLTVRPATAQASVPVGHGWHGISGDGQFAGALAAPLRPVLVGFPVNRNELRRGLVVADRLQRESGSEVVRVRRIMPSDLEVTLEPAEGSSMVVRVAADGSRAEELWCETVRASAMPDGQWFDLRRDDRLVIGGAV